MASIKHCIAIRVFFYKSLVAIFLALPVCCLAGKVYIVGGGDLGKIIYQRYIEQAGGTNAHVCIFGTNSADPQASIDFYAREFEMLGAKITPIALITQNSAWNTSLIKDGDFMFSHPESEVRISTERLANDPDIAAKVALCNAIWFGGGNQSRSIVSLLNEDGSDTLVAHAIREVIESGGVFGGTSAGGAMQSNPMIVSGISADSLSEPNGPSRVRTSTGLGITPNNLIVDQHFIKRKRLGRLQVALDDHQFNLGVGVDENTALLIDLDNGQWEVIGESQVIVVFRADIKDSWLRVTLSDGEIFTKATMSNYLEN